MLAMKAYVRDFNVKSAEDFRIHYTHMPEGRLGTLELAEHDCVYLNSLQVAQIGEHYCHFEVEKIEPGIFGVVCKSHPEF
jgi:hypothetical protein